MLFSAVSFHLFLAAPESTRDMLQLAGFDARHGICEVSGFSHAAVTMVKCYFLSEPKAAHLLEYTRMLLPSAYTLAPLDRKITASTESPFSCMRSFCLPVAMTTHHTKQYGDLGRWVTEERLDLCRLQHSTSELDILSQSPLLSTAKIT